MVRIKLSPPCHHCTRTWKVEKATKYYKTTTSNQTLILAVGFLIQNGLIAGHAFEVALLLQYDHKTKVILFIRLHRISICCREVYILC